MSHPQTLSDDRETLTQLVKRCATLCQSADAAIAKMPAEREPFLSSSLGDALKNLELILRVLGDAQDGAHKEERQGFLKRLFAKSDSDPSSKEFEPPKFDVTHQGLQGNSLTVPLAELMSFLAFGRKTGVLWVDAPAENFLVGLIDGRLMHATSDKTPEGLRLGEVLVRLGFITRRQLERFIAQRQEAGAAISGEILLKNGMISDDELHAALKYQVKQLVMRLVDTKTAIFRFREGMEVLLATKLDLDVNQLLLESARCHDEANRPGAQDTLAESWSHWQQELASEVSRAAASGSDGADEPARSAGEEKPAEAKAGASQDAQAKPEKVEHPWRKK